MSQSKVHHTPITGTPNIRTSINTALGELDSAIGDIGALAAAVFGEELADGTDSSTIASNGAYVVRNLEGLEVDSDSIITIASDRFTPAAGTYALLVTASVTASNSNNRLQLYNFTQSSEVALGMSMALDDNEAAQLMYVFSANGSDAYEIRHLAAAGGGGTLGDDDGATLGEEVYLECVLVRVGG